MASRKGFTTVEVLISLTIVAIVATIGYVIWGGSTHGKTRDARRIADVNNIKLAAEAFYQKNNRYPPLAELGTEKFFFSDQAQPWIPEITPGFIQELPKDPKQTADNLLIQFAQNIFEKLKIANVLAVHTEVGLAGNMKIESGTYQGTGGVATSSGCPGGQEQQIIVGFKPDMVLVKGGSNFAAMATSTMAGKTKSIGRQTLVFDDGIKSLDNFGFTLGTDSPILNDKRCVNELGKTYYYLAVQNKAQQFNVVTYGGNGSTQPVSVGFQPNMVLIIPEYNRKSVWKTSTMPAGQSQVIDQTLITGMITDFTASGFIVAHSDDTNDSFQTSVNKNLVTYHAIAVRSTLNAFNVLTYIGNSGCPNQEQSITGAGFQPDAVWVKGDKVIHGAIRFQNHPYRYSSIIDDNSDANDWIRYFEPDGFRAGRGSAVNYMDPVTCTATTYHAVAWKETSVSNPYHYLYNVSADRRSYNVWATFENKKDPRIYYHTEAQCKVEPPINGFTYCGAGF